MANRIKIGVFSHPWAQPVKSEDGSEMLASWVGKSPANEAATISRSKSGSIIVHCRWYDYTACKIADNESCAVEFAEMALDALANLSAEMERACVVCMGEGAIR